jgi:hypothetical protein
MPAQPTALPTKAFVSLSELAEDILNLSRARCYELIARGALPHPIYDIRTRRPMFNSELIHQARTVRQTGIGIDGSAVIFYRRERSPAVAPSPTSARARRRTPTPQVNRYPELVGNLQGLGVSQADERSVAEAVAVCFPNGLDGQQESDVIRVIFRHFRRRETA